MPVNMKGITYYRTAEACRLAGISKNTYLRWVKSGVIRDVGQRDRRGWRIFSGQDLDMLLRESSKTLSI